MTAEPEKPPEKLRVGFMGTPDFALTALKALCAAEYEIICVYSQPPRPKGRGQHIQASPVQSYAESRAIPVFTPTTLKTPEAQAAFSAHNLDIAVVAAYGLILPKAILNAPRYGCINIHASLLPRWRGASPIQRAILEGDTQSGVTLMQMDEGLDTGPEIMKETLELPARITASQLHDDLAALGGRMIVEALKELTRTAQRLPSKSQESTGVTYAHLLTKNDGRINWHNEAASIDRQIRALNPWPGVWTQNQRKRLKILAATLETDDSLPAFQEPAGMVIDQQARVICGDGNTLKLLKIQPENAKPMEAISALNGGHLKIGDLLE
ncbi:MAG: methionyl-tRNA formyltransferase [Alphaproteobacteria bacterium]|nr:methionyl-tRNA formyltransferase [Alphaproteobacteria bacterium]